MFVVTSNVVLRVCAVQHKTCFLGRCLSLYTTEGFASYSCVVLMDRTCHGCGQCTSVLKLWLFHFSQGWWSTAPLI